MDLEKKSFKIQKCVLYTFGISVGFTAKDLHDMNTEEL